MTPDSANDLDAGRPQPLSPPSDVPWSSVGGLAFLLLFLVIHVFFFHFSMLLQGRPPDMNTEMAGSNAVILGLVFLFLHRRTGTSTNAARALGLHVREPRRAIRRALVVFGLGAVAVAAWMLLEMIVLLMLGIEPPPQRIVQWLHEQTRGGFSFEVLYFIALAVAFVPLVEEVVFRGMLYLPLRRRVGALRAALLVSLLFALIHFYLPGMGHLFIVALVFTCAFEATGTIWAAVGAHALHNAVMIALLLLFPLR